MKPQFEIPLFFTRLLWWAGLLFSLAVPFLIVNLVESLAPSKGDWLASLPFTRGAMLAGLPMLWWLLLLPKHSRPGRLAFGSGASLIYAFFALAVFEIPCGC